MENLVVSISTIVIACIALGISIWQGWATRLHNKLSVKPLLDITTFYSETEPFIGVVVENHGVGPAIIKDFIVYIDGQPAIVDSVEAADKVYNATLSIGNEINYWHPEGDSVLKQGGGKEILWYRKEDWTTKGVEEFKETLSHLSFKFIYESIYREEFEISTHVG